MHFIILTSLLVSIQNSHLRWMNSLIQIDGDAHFTLVANVHLADGESNYVILTTLSCEGFKYTKESRQTI